MCLFLSRQQPRKQVVIDVPARQYDADPSAVLRKLPEHHGGRRRRAGRLDQHLHAKQHEPHSCDNFIVRYGEHLFGILSCNWKSQLARFLHTQAVGDRRGRSDGNALAGFD